MSLIVAGRFDNVDQVSAALAALQQSGLARDEYAAYYVAPPGEHGLYPLGGDAHHDAGTRAAGRGAAVGAVTGGAAGSVVGGFAGSYAGGGIGVPVGAIVGAGIGAYVGSLVGALRKTQEPVRPTREEPLERPGGPMVAVCAARPGTDRQAFEILAATGAHSIERAEGEWRDGDWKDFDPRTPTETLKQVD